MAAPTCSDAVAGTAPAATRRLKLTRPSASRIKARKLRKKAAGGGKRPRVAASKRVMAIRRKMEALTRLVPLCGEAGAAGWESGGERRPLDELLLHAAGYIVRLQMQVRVMQVMVQALNNLPED